MTMKIVFWSNIYTRHQESLSLALNSLVDQYVFIAEADRGRSFETLGKEAGHEPSFVWHAASDNRAKLIRWVRQNADMVILGVPAPDLVRACRKRKLLLFRYSERPFKKEPTRTGMLLRAIRWRMWNPPRIPIYLLCAGACVADDYRKIGMFRNRTYKWGYFSEYRRKDTIETLMSEKDPRQILWAGRLLSWKHPETALYLAKELAEKGTEFTLKLVGSGPMKEELEILREKLEIEAYVELEDTKSPEELRILMEHSGIFLMTSSREEGWGAVVNEAMSCGCAVIGSSETGSVPYLIQSGENGYIYTYGNADSLLAKTERLLQSPSLQRKMGVEACKTIETEWNAGEAAGRLIALAESLLHERRHREYESGPCSRADFAPEDKQQYDVERT